MKGFSLIELLVVVIIMGILTAIVSPIILGQVNKAKTAEAYSTLREANSAQLLYLLLHGTFAPDADTLKAGISLETANYSYTVSGDATAGDIEAHPKGLLVLGYRGCIYADPNLDKPAIVVGSFGQTPPPCH